VESAFLLDIAVEALLWLYHVWRGRLHSLVVESTTILQLFAGKDEALLVRGDTVVLRSASKVAHCESRCTLPCPGSWL